VQQQNVVTDSIEEKSSAGGAIDMKSALSEKDSVGEGRPHIDHDSKARDDGDGSFAASPLSLHVESISEIPTRDALSDSEKLTEGGAPRPSASGVDELSQPEELTSEPKADLFQQTVEGLEPVITSPKSKRNRKKSDKAS
jgi:hypothetical protein